MNAQEFQVLAGIRAKREKGIGGEQIVREDIPIGQIRRGFQTIRLPRHRFPSDAQFCVELGNRSQSKRFVVGIRKNHEDGQMVGRNNVIVCLEGRRRRWIRQQIRPKNLTAHDVRNQQPARHDVIVAFVEPGDRLN